MNSAANHRIAGLDLIRGLAILLVLLRHAWPGAIGNAGIVGVVVFFVLSGYLITAILQRDITKFGKVRYGHFYRNRALRLLPALLVVTAVFAIGETIFNILGDRDRVLHTVVVALTYTGDIPYLNEISQGLSHLWTLAVEEQFYLLWPILLTLALRRKMLVRTVVLLASVTVILCIGTLVISAPNFSDVYRLPTSWALAIILGSAARLWQSRVHSAAGPRQRQALLAGCGLLVLLAISFAPDWKNEAFLYLGAVPVISAATIALIVFAEKWKDLPTPYLRPLLFLGTISYGAYLWNYLLAQWLHVGNGGDWRSFASIGLTLAAATLSWYLIEKPILALKPRLDARAQAREPGWQSKVDDDRGGSPVTQDPANS